ncbi:ImmA/IrrE family metallo-endopeptidase [Cutibacterium equinum]|uniref:ImmA/IrrE family metallo-endopeptidase n=1 Tax=Cutibacterium equinum TaxID=3016342 RepID=A0ABY7QZV2_9ACTN|nr:ImmA/IrrE family metallo-endopeptidase [Cutibacterium equinum]WCC79994.1 ImmA/IrrE family metallo-endopeptidase [Cutibacterium equinum]
MTDNYTDYAVATGEFIQEWLDDHRMTAAELARRTGFSRKHISMVLAGAPVSPDFANRLELVTRVPAERWLALEGQYRADLERLGLEQRLAEDDSLLETFLPSLKVLRKLGVIQGTRRNPGRLMVELMSFFQVGSPEALVPRNLVPNAAFLKSTTLDAVTASLATWLRLAQIRAAEEPPVVAFDRSVLISSLPDVRRLSRKLADDPTAFVTRLGEAGVRVVLLEEIPGCRAYGATFWDEHGPVIVLSARGKQDGALWFTLFHEIGHVLLHPNCVFVEGSDSDLATAAQEEEANNFAANWLIPAEYAAEAATLRSKAAVVAFAERLEVSPGVIMQHLHHHGYWRHQNGRDLYVKLAILEAD